LKFWANAVNMEIRVMEDFDAYKSILDFFEGIFDWIWVYIAPAWPIIGTFLLIIIAILVFVRFLSRG
jgi:hypothetical protein